MHFCGFCHMLSEDIEAEHFWDNHKILVIVHCDNCGTFKYQYLKDKEEENAKTD